jgi:hypothetical protein
MLGQPDFGFNAFLVFNQIAAGPGCRGGAQL